MIMTNINEIYLKYILINYVVHVIIAVTNRLNTFFLNCFGLQDYD